MGRPRDLDPGASPLALFGAELRRYREKAQLSQESMSKLLICSPGLVSHIECARRSPSLELAQKCDEIFGLDETFTRLYNLLVRSPSPQWFLRWQEEAEPRATVLRSWDPLLVPGLLQTEEYAREILSGAPNATVIETHERVRSRMQRKEILEGSEPPAIWVLLDEGVLHRPIGTPKVMREQLEYLYDMAQRPALAIQVVPFSARSTTGLTGAFIIAELPDGPDLVYVEGLAEGHVTGDPDAVKVVWSYYDAIRVEAHPQHVSLKMIKEAAERWTKAR
jgi:Helix-turn-helix.